MIRKRDGSNARRLGYNFLGRAISGFEFDSGTHMHSEGHEYPSMIRFESEFNGCVQLELGAEFELGAGREVTSLPESLPESSAECSCNHP